VQGEKLTPLILLNCIALVLYNHNYATIIYSKVRSRDVARHGVGEA